MADTGRGLPLLSGPPPRQQDSPRAEISCRKCNKEFNIIFTRARRCNHCGYSYCTSCSDYQALMPRTAVTNVADMTASVGTGGTTGPGYVVMPVCAFCIENLTITANGRGHLKTLPLSNLRKYANAYDISVEHALEKDDVIDAIIAARGANGCLSPANEDFYRKHSVPSRPPGSRARPRGLFSRIAEEINPTSPRTTSAPLTVPSPSADDITARRRSERESFARPDLEASRSQSPLNQQEQLQPRYPPPSSPPPMQRSPSQSQSQYRSPPHSPPVSSPPQSPPQQTQSQPQTPPHPQGSDPGHFSSQYRSPPRPRPVPQPQPRSQPYSPRPHPANLHSFSRPQSQAYPYPNPRPNSAYGYQPTSYATNFNFNLNVPPSPTSPRAGPRQRATSAHPSSTPHSHPQPPRTPVPAPTLDELLVLDKVQIAALPISTLKTILFANHIPLRAGMVLEKGELVERVIRLVDAERGERQRHELEEEREREAERERERDRLAEEERATDELARELEEEDRRRRQGGEDVDEEGEKPPSPPPKVQPKVEKEKAAMAATLERTGLCVICQDEEANIAIVDCGHLAMCRACSDLIMASSRECPLCRTRIVTEARLLRIFKT